MTRFVNPEIASILDMLVYCRPFRSNTEKRFIKRFISPLGVKQDQFGNRIKRIGTAPILWSSHTDTCHRVPGLQMLSTDGHKVGIHKKSKANCLGADDGAGVWLMVEMIKANVPGLYVFHRGEEHGCKGSKFIAENRKDILRGIEAAVAFDRKGTSSVITHQMSMRCCSADFGNAMAKVLGNGYKLDDTGSFTDTASYTGLVGECSNISVGYQGEHWTGETLDMDHLRRLRDTVCRADFSALPFERKPGEKEWKYENLGGDDWWTGYRDTGTKSNGTAIVGGVRRYVEGWRGKANSDYRPDVDLPVGERRSTYADSKPTLAMLCRDHPEVAAMMLEGVGYTPDDLIAELDGLGGYGL